MNCESIKDEGDEREIYSWFDEVELWGTLKKDKKKQKKCENY